MANNPIQRFVDIAAGAVITKAERRELGVFDECNAKEQYKLRQIRVGLQFPANGVRYTALLTVPGGLFIGPIDIPFRFNIECPVNIEFTSDKANSERQQIMCTVHDLPDSPDLYGATYFIPDASAGSEIPPVNFVHIPDWVVAVTIYSGGTLIWYDVGGNNLGTATGPLMVARPRLAEFIAVSTEGQPSVLFHY